MKTYQFYKVPNLDAKVGIAFNGKRYAIYFPSMGTSQRKGRPNLRRNPDRYALHQSMLDMLARFASGLKRSRLDHLRVEFYTSGPTDKATKLQPIRPTESSGRKGVDLYDFDHTRVDERGNYAYTLYLTKYTLSRKVLTNKGQCDYLAQYLGLEPTESGRAIAVRWL